MSIEMLNRCDAPQNVFHVVDGGRLATDISAHNVYVWVETNWNLFCRIPVHLHPNTRYN